MSDFEKLQATLKDKWLDYYEANRSWIDKLINIWGKYDGSVHRPSAPFILGAIGSLEPKIRDYLIPLCGIDTGGNEIVRALGLNFDPRTELEKRAEEAAKIQEAKIVPLLPDDKYSIQSDIEYLNQIREEIKQQENSK
jgi:hypothetical protein